MNGRHKPNSTRPPGGPGKRAKDKSYEGVIDANSVYEIEAFARILGITRQDVNDRFRKRGLRAIENGAQAFIRGATFNAWLAERETNWGEKPKPDSTMED